MASCKKKMCSTLGSITHAFKRILSLNHKGKRLSEQLKQSTHSFDSFMSGSSSLESQELQHPWNDPVSTAYHIWCHALVVSCLYRQDWECDKSRWSKATVFSPSKWLLDSNVNFGRRWEHNKSGTGHYPQPLIFGLASFLFLLCFDLSLSNPAQTLFTYTVMWLSTGCSIGMQQVRMV